MMSSGRIWRFAVAAALFLWPRVASPFEVVFVKKQLRNGLTLIVHEDHQTPEVAVNLMFRVGSKDDPADQKGVAHLVEHLVVASATPRSANNANSWMLDAGAYSEGATTREYTEYYGTCPPTTLPLFLWVLGDRWSSFDPSPELLAQQRVDVRNERANTYENVPYKRAWLRMPTLLYPPPHPYTSHALGSPKYIESATLDDARAFFRRHYVPSIASLVVAGDVKPAQVEVLVQRYLGFVSPGSASPIASAPLAPIPGVVREVIEDEVDYTEVVMAFRSPHRRAQGDAELRVLAQILNAAAGGRLRKAMVDNGLVVTANALQESSMLAGEFKVWAVYRAGLDAVIEDRINTVLEKVLAAPPTQAEVERAQNQLELEFLDGLQSLSARANALNLYWATGGDPAEINDQIRKYREVTPAGVWEQAKKTLTMNARIILRIVRPKPPLPAVPKGGG